MVKPTDLKVLHVITDPDRRGAQMFATDLDAALTRRGLEVTTVALAPGMRAEVLPVPTLGPSRLGLSTLRELRRRMGQADVAVAFGSTCLPACTLAGLSAGIPFIYRSIGELGYWANTPMRRARVRFGLHRAAAVVVLWPQAADLLAEQYGVDRQRLRVIPRGVPATSFPPVDVTRRQEARGRLELAPHRPTLAVVGALAPEKNVGAAIQLLEALPDHQLLVVGDGPLRPRLQAQAQRVAPGRVAFTGTVDDLRSVYAATNVVLLTSRSEGMPGVLIEAGLSGVPAVATDVGAVREVVLSGKTGEVVRRDDPVQLAEAVRVALAREETYGPAARRHCLARFEIEVVAASWERLLTEVSHPGSWPVRGPLTVEHPRSESEH